MTEKCLEILPPQALSVPVPGQIEIVFSFEEDKASLSCQQHLALSLAPGWPWPRSEVAVAREGQSQALTNTPRQESWNVKPASRSLENLESDTVFLLRKTSSEKSFKKLCNLVLAKLI